MEIDSINLIEPPSIEKIVRTFLCYNCKQNQIIIILEDKYFLFDCKTLCVDPFQKPSAENKPRCIAYCQLLDEFIVIFSDFRAFYLGGKASEDILDQSMISRNTSFDVDQSISRSYCDKPIINPLQWPEDCFKHFELAYKKYLNKQHDLAISMVSCHIPFSTFTEIVIRFSDVITLTSSSVLEVESKSLARKLDNIAYSNSQLISFLKDSGYWKQFRTHSDHVTIINSSCFHLLKNLERSKLCFIVHKFCDVHEIFLISLIKLNDFYSFSPNDTPNPPFIHQIFAYILSNEEDFIKSNSKESVEDLWNSIHDFLCECTDVFYSTANELSAFSKSVDSSSSIEFENVHSSEEWSFIVNDSTINALISHINLVINYTKVHNLNIQDSRVILLCKRVLSSLKLSSRLINNRFTDIFLFSCCTIIKNLENSNFIMPALDLATSFLIFDETIRLCVTYNKFDILSTYKAQWCVYDFEKTINSWLAKNRKWNLLANQLDHKNIAEICHQFPQLNWVYHIKENDYRQAQLSLKDVARTENKIFFKKTYCSLYRILEYIDDENFDSEINYYLDQINYQETTTKFISNETVPQDLLPLNELLRRQLFDSNVIMNCDLILKSFNLVLQANLQDNSDLVSLIWSSVVLADPYLKRNDLIMLSTCQKFSFFYECLLAVINHDEDLALLNKNLPSCIHQFLHNHLDEPLFPVFYDRMNSVFEIFQDNVLSN